MHARAVAHVFHGRTMSRYTASRAATAAVPIANPTRVASAFGLSPYALESTPRYSYISGWVHSRMTPGDGRTHNPPVSRIRSAIG